MHCSATPKILPAAWQRFFASVAFLLFFHVVFAVPTHALNRIHTPGSFDVDQTGAATYSVPIEVPPGTAGMQPNLSLEYNSHRSDGLVGVGWSLKGISSITRCPKTIAQDGAAGSVKFDLNDRYCLDGQRLMLVSGSYGAANSEYRTERESFARIVARGSTTTGPAWFEVHTRNGRVIEFGNTADSQVQDQWGNNVVVWAQNKVTDASGNYFTVTYAESGGQYWPQWIDYTGNVAAGITPYNRVYFYYFGPRPLGKIQLPTPYGTANLDVLLGLIRTTNTNSTVKDYWLGYQAGYPVVAKLPPSGCVCHR